MRAPTATSAAGERYWLAALVVFVAVFCVWPVARLSLEAVLPAGRLDLDVARRVLASPATWRATWRTLDTSLCATVLSIGLGSAFAVLVALTDVRAKAAIVFCVMLPLMVPSQVTAIAWISLFGPSSALLNAVGAAPPPGSPHPIYGRGGIILLLGLEHAPFVFLAVRAALRAVPRELVEAARASGARPVRVLRSVALPLALPGLAAGALLAFVSSIGNFGVPALLGIPAGYDTLTTLIYQRLAGFGPRVLSDMAVLSLLIGALALAGVWLQVGVTRAGDYRAAGHAPPFAGWSLGPARPAVELVCWTVLAIGVAVPFVALIASSLVAAIGVPLTFETMTLRNFVEAMFVQASTARAFANSFLLSTAAALVLAAVAVPLGYFLAWRARTSMRVLSALIELPYAVPGIVLAIAFILVFLRPLPILGVSIYGTLWIILAAYLARFLALSVRPVVSAFAQLDPALDEAAQSAGARLGRRLRTVVLPLVAPAALAGALLVFLTALNELTVSALLWSSGAETLGVTVFSLQEAGDAPLAAAISVIAVVVVVALMGALTLLARRLPPGTLPWAR